MKIKTLYLVIYMLLVTSAGSSQTREELQKHLDLVNAIPKQITDGNIAEAVGASQTVFAYRPKMLEMTLEAIVAGRINRGDQNASRYVRGLATSKSMELIRLITPMLIWEGSLQSTDKDSLEVARKKLIHLLADTIKISSKRELYTLMTLKRLQLTGTVTKNQCADILRKIIDNLRQGTVDTEIANRATAERRAWSRYLTAYSYNELFQLSSDFNLLYQASLFSPDMSDRSVSSAYFYDAAMLGQKNPISEFRELYLRHLIQSSKKEEALSFLAQMAFIDPTPVNRQALKDFYITELGKSNFGDYWRSFLNNSGKAIPPLELKFADTTLDLTMASNKWILIDVWGTWCSPCLKELPALQEYYTASLTNKNYAEVYTLSYSSTKLPEFMEKNKYTFPVSEVDKKTTQLLSVIGFPTKILITPERKALKIPFNSDWKQILATYMTVD